MDRRIPLAVLAVSAALAGTTAMTRAAPAAASTLTPSSFELKWSAGPLSDQDHPIAESSPSVATLDTGGPVAMVGDRLGQLYAFHLSNGTSPSGWPVGVGAPIDSTPSALPARAGQPNVVFVGAGNAFDPNAGGYLAFGPTGRRIWGTRSIDPQSDFAPAAGVQASLTVTSFMGRTGVFAGALGQESTALAGASGRTLTGWPFFSADSVFSTAAAADLYRTGQKELVVGGASTAGQALGQVYRNGGHLRILNGEGGVICRYDTDQEVDSSPAVGAFLPGGADGIVVGTGSFYGSAADTDTVEAFDPFCHRVWSTRLDGLTGSSPALADVSESGHLDVVEGTDRISGGSVWVLDAATGRPLWHVAVTGRVIGSVVTADLGDQGHQDLLVPTTLGTDVIDGRSGARVTVLTGAGFQNSPLVTDDPDGLTGITLAGYEGSNRGVVYHYEVAGSSGARATARGSWPMFHHDPQRTGVQPELSARPTSACAVPAAARFGYQMVASDGGVFSFGPPFCGSTGGRYLNRPVVGAADAPGRGGYWAVASDGGVFTFGGARFYGSTGGVHLTKPVVAMAATADGRGYWLAGADGGVFTFGGARFYGSAAHYHLRAPVVAMAATADSRGYFLATADGGVFAFGDAVFQGSKARARLAARIVGIAEDRATGGYWLVGADGGVFTFDAPYLGSTGGLRLRSPITGVAATADGRGYWLAGADGGVFSYGEALFRGSTSGMALRRPVVALIGQAG